MNPVQSPHHVGSKVERAFLRPLFIHVIAELFDALRHFKRSWWLVLAFTNFDTRGTPIACIRCNAIECGPVKVKQMRWSEFERPVWLEIGLHHVGYRPKLLN